MMKAEISREPNERELDNSSHHRETDETQDGRRTVADDDRDNKNCRLRCSIQSIHPPADLRLNRNETTNQEE